MLKAISAIESFVKNVDELHFAENEILQSAVLMQFLIMNETIAHVDNELLCKYAYPWYKIRAFRNFIAPSISAFE
ncbi:MAG: DUF86 domain-containing protein [Flavobacteriales bacterium]